MRILAVLAVLIATILAVPVATGTESPISPPPVYVPTEQEAKVQPTPTPRDIPEGLQPPPRPVPIEMCEVCVPWWGCTDVRCEDADDFLEYWTQLIP